MNKIRNALDRLYHSFKGHLIVTVWNDTESHSFYAQDIYTSEGRLMADDLTSGIPFELKPVYNVLITAA